MKCGLILIVLLNSFSVASGQETGKGLPAPDEAAKLTALFRKQAHEMMKEYHFSLPERPDVEVQFISQPLMYWTNPVAGNWEGVVYLWTAEGRPAVIVSPLHHSDRRKMAHEFHQLIDTPLTAMRNDFVVWKTAQSGVTWKRLPDSDEPNTSEKLRALQMRAFARDFQPRKLVPTKFGEICDCCPNMCFEIKLQKGKR